MKVRILSFLFLSVLLASCEKKQNVEVVENQEKLPETPAVNQEPASNEVQCFLFTNGKDSVRMSYQNNKGEIYGWLNYDFYEKDGSIGEVKGKAYGDTLKLAYQFIAEGKFNAQEVYFLKKDGKLFRGAGELKENPDKSMSYENPKNIIYNDYTPLGNLGSCPEDFIKMKDQKFYMQIKNSPNR